MHPKCINKILSLKYRERKENGAPLPSPGDSGRYFARRYFYGKKRRRKQTTST